MPYDEKKIKGTYDDMFADEKPEVETAKGTLDNTFAEKKPEVSTIKGTYEGTFGEQQPTVQPSPSVTTVTDGNSVKTDVSKPVQQEDNPYSGLDASIKVLQEAQKRYEWANETPEQKAARERREKSKRLIASIGDGLRAISNIVYTSKYAPNMYDHEKDGQVKKVDARLDKLNAERDKAKDIWLNYALKIGDLQNAKAADKYKRERDKAADDAAAAAAAYKRAKDAADAAYKAGRDKANDAFREKQLEAQNKNAADKLAQDLKKHNDNLAQRKHEDANRTALGKARNAIEADKAKAAAKNGGKSGGKSGTGKKNEPKANTIRLHDNSVVEYDPKLVGGLNGYAPDMVKKARKAALVYKDNYAKAEGAEKGSGKKWKNLQNHYEAVANALENAKTKEELNNLIVANIGDFPTLDGAVRQTLGLPPAKNTPKFDPNKHKRGKGASGTASSSASSSASEKKNFKLD